MGDGAELLFSKFYSNVRSGANDRDVLARLGQVVTTRDNSLDVHGKLILKCLDKNGVLSPEHVPVGPVSHPVTLCSYGEIIEGDYVVMEKSLKVSVVTVFLFLPLAFIFDSFFSSIFGYRSQKRQQNF